jgi:hypothetical protein
MHTLGRATRRLGLTSIFAAAALCLGPAVGSAAASGLIPTKTVVTSSAVTGSGATLSATVGTGLLLTPTGTVSFTDQSNNTPLGTARLSGPCLFSIGSCEATVHISAASLSSGVNTIQASYSGDLLSKPSVGIGYLTLCGQGSYCEAYGTSADGTAALDVRAGPSQNPDGESVAIGFTTTPLSCSTPNTGDIGVWTVSDPTVPELVVMDTFGTAGQNAQNANPITESSDGHFCLAQPTPFTTASGAPAIEVDGMFEGALPVCNDGETNLPCIDGASFTSGEGGPDYEIDVALVAPNQSEASVDTDPHGGP